MQVTKISAILLLSMVFMALQPATSHAFQSGDVEGHDSLYANDIPLVIVRFNKQRVRYESQLYKAISQAVKIKPNLKIALVAYIPQTGRNKAQDRQHRKISEHNLQKVAASLVKMGVPKESINLSRLSDHTLRYDEVHVFVR